MWFWLALAMLILATGAVLTGLWRLAGNGARSVASGVPLSSHGWPMATVLGLGLLLAATGVLVFLLLARAWHVQPSMVMVMDARAALLARDAWSASGRIVMLTITALGNPVTLWVLGGAIGLLLLRRRAWALLIGWAAALAGNAVWNPALKGAYERLRQEPDVSHLVSHGFSFPSGHSSGAMVTYGMLAYLASRLLPPRCCLPALWLASALVLAIGASRVYLQAHYLSDVLAGFASGGAWLAACVAASAAWQIGRQRPWN